ncbi:ABC transporter ATP-binding protein [Verrucomicrobiota bacterium]
MIKVANLTKRFGKTTAIDNLSFEVARGEIVGFLGPNGAGKTTTMRILSCFLSPTGGEVTIDGLDVFAESVEVRRKIGYLPENAPIYPDMRVKEYLAYRGRLKGLRGKKLRARMDEVISHCGLGSVRNRIVGQLSMGYTKRVGLADSLIHDPDLLILDEPTIGLDPLQIRHIRNLIKNFAQSHTVLLSSHILPEVEMICERVFILNKGRIAASDTTDNLVGLIKGNQQVIAEVYGPHHEIIDRIKTIPGVIKVSCEPAGEYSRFLCECRKETDIRADLFKTITANNWILRELTAGKRNLEDVFVEMTREEQ